MNRLALIAFFLTGCTVSPPKSELLQITGIKQGLMREEKGVWQVYQTGDTFPYQENGACTVAGQSVSACMWYGLEFDFTSPAEITRLTCVAKMSNPSDIVTYATTEATNVERFNFELTLEGRNGHASHPGYSVRSAEETGNDFMQVECSFGGSVVLTYGFEIHGV